MEVLVEAKNVTAEGYKKAAEDSEKAGAETGNKFSRGFNKTMKTASTVGAAAFAAGLIYAVDAGEKLEGSQLSLSKAIEHTHGSMSEVSGDLDKVRKKMEGYGYTNAQVDDSLAKLTNSTGNVKIAIQLEQVAADMAAKRHIDLATATGLLTKAAMGNAKSMKDMGVTVASGATWAKATASANQLLGDRIKAAGGMANFAKSQHITLAQAQDLVRRAADGSIPSLNKLGIDVLPKSATAAQRMAEFTAVMGAKLKGEAAAGAETTAGKMNILKARMTDAAASIGMKMMPAISGLLNFFMQHSTAVMVFVGALAALSVAVKVAEGIKALAAAFKILNIAMSANVIGLIVLAIAALAFLIIKYHTQIWNFLTKYWNDVFQFIKRIWNDILSFAKQWWPLLLGVGGVVYKYHNDIWQFIQKIWNNVLTFIKRIWNDVLSFARQWWPLLLGPAGVVAKYHNDIFNFIQRIWNNILSFLRRLWNDILGAGRTWMSNLFNVYTNGWNNISNGIRNIWNNILGGARNWMSNFLNVMRSGLGSMTSIGKALIQNIWNGAKSVVGGITNFFSGFAKGIVNVFKKIWGWFSPSAVMYQGGKALMEGLGNGIKDHAHLAVKQASGVASKVANAGSGVMRWEPLVLQALKMEGLPAYLASQVLYQMQTESGGNPNAINLTDSNAAAGDPSRGLLQTIMSTFMAYHWPGTSYNIYDPLANIAAAINYARHVYGPTLESGGMGMGSGHGYASGGIASGWITVGEYGRELMKVPPGTQIRPHSQAMGSGGSGVVQIEISGGQSDFDRFMLEWIRKHAVIKGGGNVQTAFGVH